MLNTLSLLACKTRNLLLSSRLSVRLASRPERKLAALLLVALLAACAPFSAPTIIPTDLPHKAHFVISAPRDPNSQATPFQPESPTVTLTSSPVPPTDTTTPPPTSTDPAATSTTAAPTGGGSPTSPPADTGRTHYTFYLTLDYARKAVAVNETIRYVNTTGQSLSDVVLAVQPNLWGSCFTLVTLSEDDTEVSNYSLSGERLTIYPAQALAPGASTSFALGYSLSLPWKAADGTFGYTSAQVNLTDWYPFVVPYSGGWVLHDTWPFGEQFVYDSADFDVYVKVSDPGVVVAASAPEEPNGDTTHYHLEGARTFVLSASDIYQVDESAVGSIKIRSYYFTGHENASQAVVWMATQSIALYEAKFAPYPYQSLSIVETGLPDGQEFDGLVFLGSTFYSDYNGTARSNLVTIGTHEIAHQWWFGLVGDDQATEPWLDEAMSIYSERLFYEYNYPKYGDWWWNFRVNYFGPHGYVDSSVYDFATFRGYVDAVYLNGANFLEDIRTRIGDDAFFAFLKDYAARYSYGRATTAGFFAVLREHTNRDFSDIMQAYFQGQY